jgi:hypothetical protein
VAIHSISYISEAWRQQEIAQSLFENQEGQKTLDTYSCKSDYAIKIYLTEVR